MNKFLVVFLSLILSGCFGSDIKPVDPFPNDADLMGCDYPLREKDSDAALSDAYLRSLSEIEVCNERLKGVREAKRKYLELIEN